MSEHVLCTVCLLLLLECLSAADRLAETDRLGLDVVVLDRAALSALSVSSKPSRLAESWLLQALILVHSQGRLLPGAQKFVYKLLGNRRFGPFIA